MYDDKHGYKTERRTTSGVINGGLPVKKLVAVFAKGGAAIGTLTVHDDATNGATTVVRALTCPITTWVSSETFPQAVSKLFAQLDANISECLVVFEPYS